MGDKIGTPDMDLLDGTNYFTWKICMEDILYVMDLYQPIQTLDPPKDMNPKSWQLLNRKTVATIRQYIHSSVLQHVLNDTNAYLLWEKLKSMYELKNTLMNQVNLMRKLRDLRYKDGESMVLYLNDFQGLVNQMSALGLSFDDQEQAVWLLNSVPQEDFDTVVCSLIDSDSEGKMSLVSVKRYLLQKEVERRGMEVVRGKSKERSGSESRGKVVCYYCNKPGHIRKFCWEKKRDKSSYV